MMLRLVFRHQETVPEKGITSELMSHAQQQRKRTFDDLRQLCLRGKRKRTAHY